MINYHRKKNIQFYNISSKASYNLLQPFEYLLKRKLQNNFVKFTNVESFIDMTPEMEFNNK